jgi:multiple sugar transport system ATP-binding protein
VPGVPARGPVTLGFRPEHVELAPPGNGGFAGEVYVVEPLGNETLVAVRAGDALVNVRAGADFARPVGERCALRPAPQQVHVFDRESGEALAHTSAHGTAPVTAGAGARRAHE